MQHNTNTVVMVEPTCFRRNEQTVATNSFQQKTDLSESANKMALAEFVDFSSRLKAAGIRVEILENREGIDTPDAVFPNNWFSTHRDGIVVQYPMEHLNRRTERRLDMAGILQVRCDFRPKEILDLSPFEHHGTYLEGTGSVVFDHVHQIAYACLSSRTDEPILKRLCQYLGYEPFLFIAKDEAGNDIYHTNVMMAVGENWAVICLDAIPEALAVTVAAKLEQSGKKVLAITHSQMNHFCGNILELIDNNGRKVVAMSKKAWNHFTKEQQDYFSASGKVVYSDLDTIETIGGGGARCMLAEIFN